MGISETIFIFAWLYKIKATHAVVAQLAERRLPKPQVTSSTLATAQKFISSTKIEYRRFLQSFCRKRMMDLRFFYVFLLSLFVLFLPL